MEIKYNWKFSDTVFTKDKGAVFSTFACGGGSTLGYKLAGFDVIGCNDIDVKMNKCYVTNHKPKYNFLMDIRELNKMADRGELPPALYNLTIFDGSPPCSSFSLAGNRDKDWGKEKVFKEGQAKQVLDTLFFDFIELAGKLQSKIVVAENVEGLTFGEAKEYVKKIYNDFSKVGYYCQHHLLDGSTMGLPQRRVRVFFIAIRKDLRCKYLSHLRNVDMFNEAPFLDLSFNEAEIPFGEIQEEDNNREKLSEKEILMWNDTDELGYHYKMHPTHGKRLFGFFYKMMKNRVARTVMAGGCYAIEDKPEKINRNEIVKVSSFPLDYDFCDESPYTICGMSVPPLMMGKIAERIQEQWLSFIPETFSLDLL